MPFETINDALKILACTGALIIAAYGLNRVFSRLKSKNQGIGPNSIKAIGVLLLLPTLIILAITADIKSEALTALLGTVAGYVLSNGKSSDD